MTVEEETALLRQGLTESLFNVRIMQNQIRPLYVEALVADALAPEWTYVGNDWCGWDFGEFGEAARG